MLRGPRLTEVPQGVITLPAHCPWTVWLVNAGPQELPDSLGGLGCLGGAEQELVDVG